MNRLLFRPLIVWGLICLSTPAAKIPPRLLAAVPQENASSDEPVRNDLLISGVYPHLTTYGIYSQGGAHRRSGHSECGIGAIVPWAGKLWMVNYAPHQPRGSEHKLYSIDPRKQELMIHPESVGGTPAGRMIHRESNQLLMAHYLIDSQGNVRVISPRKMPMRVTAIARHLKDPANWVYYVDMEGAIWEANVHTLAVKQLFKKPVPGWHAKGGYTSQGRLVVSNNGELAVGDYSSVLVGGKARHAEEAGVLAEWDGSQWRIVERRQYTDVTGPDGIQGGREDNERLWAIGWDRRSLRLKLLEDGKWSTYLLPKAAYNNDARHGWYTEWPRIRAIPEGRWMMDMHGMFFDFPVTFSRGNSAGIRPIGSHLRYVPDFCDWNGTLVLASDETSIQGNPLAGQPQSNLWFGSYQDLKQWGPASGFGGPWLEDPVAANCPSDPFLIAGFDRQVLHLAIGRSQPQNTGLLRTSDQQPIKELPTRLLHLPRVTVPRGDWHQPGAGFEFTINQPALVYLAVDERGKAEPDKSWERTDLFITWGSQRRDRVYQRRFGAGRVRIPVNKTEHQPRAFGMPHMAFVEGTQPSSLKLECSPDAKVTFPDTVAEQPTPGDVRLRLEMDAKGDGNWEFLEEVVLAEGGYRPYYFPDDLEAVWFRVTADRDCVATAYLHQTTATFADGATPENQRLFQGLASLSDSQFVPARIYPAKHNRNLSVLDGEGRGFEFTKRQFDFQVTAPDQELDKLLAVKPAFTVDDASVRVEYLGQTYRLPKGAVGYDQPWQGSWPRAMREVQSERQLANIHGTFYEVPLLTNEAPPVIPLLRPVASHDKRITDYCSWNGLLVLAGVKSTATNDGHVFIDSDAQIGLWLGGVDDLWKLGKPVGHGGPWKDSEVTAGQPSDPYLIRGYDQRTLYLSHRADQPVQFTLEVDLTGLGHWRTYQKFAVAPEETLSYQFPDDYHVAWIRLVADQPTRATAQLTYQ